MLFVLLTTFNAIQFLRFFFGSVVATGDRQHVVRAFRRDGEREEHGYGEHGRLGGYVSYGLVLVGNIELVEVVCQVDGAYEFKCEQRDE